MKIYNSFTQTKEEFVPRETGKVGIYVCGITTYDYLHLGHARMLVAFDIVTRYLRSQGLAVEYVRNITDIDDKIINRAKENGEVFTDLTTRFIDAMHEDEAALGVLPPDQEPRATGHIGEIVALIQTLIEKDNAYPAANGDVYFSVSSFADYGKLSKKKMDELLDGARIAIGELKRDPRDFVLWKRAEEGGVGWDSPWGYGRPGWHIECSAMSSCCLGDTFDIHGGGSDLLFPHHENEIAQSCSLGSEDEFAQIWMHNEMLQVNGKKMSKSLGNFFSPKDLIDQGISGDSLRLMYLGTHYRKPLDWTENKVEESQKLQIKWEKLVANCESGVISEKVLNAVADDLNTPLALSEMHKLAKSGNVKDLKASGGFLGLFDNPISHKSETILPDEVQNLITELLNERADARFKKDYAKADKLRDGFVKAGLIISDTENGIDWELGENFDLKKLEALKW